MNKTLCLLLFSIIIFSCKAPIDVAYFQNTENLEKISSTNTFAPKFKPDDVIDISVSAADMDTARPFNLSQGNSISETESGAPGPNSQASGYLIDTDGNIEFPVLGMLKVSGLTRVGLTKILKTKLKVYINDPIVNVRLQNFKITVLGEVNRPGSYTITNERLTIIEALGMAGDLTIKGKRQNVLVIRETDSLKTYHKIDLTSKNIFNRPAYYLTQNDVVYVEPNESKIRTSKTNSNALSIIISVSTFAITVLSFLVLR